MSIAPSPVADTAPSASASSAASRRDARTRALRVVESPWFTVVALAALTVVAGLTRMRALGAAMWLDEAQAFHISARHLGDIPHLLRLDGSPPLYYVALHFWMRVFGENETWAHLMSVGFAAACVPVAWLAGRLAGGPRAAWIAAAIIAFNPFLSTYGDQARMYTLLTFLSLAVLAAFLAAYVHRRRWAVPLFSVALALALYTHNWSFFLAAGCALAVAVLWLAGDRDRRLLIDAIAGFALAAVLYVPWVPVLLDQIRTTGAPWSVHPTTRALLRALQEMFGSEGPEVLLVLLGGAGLVALARRHRSPREAGGAAATGLVCLGLIVTALVFCHFTLAWAPRYLAVLLGPVAVLAAAGMAQLRGLGIAAAVLVVAITVGQPRLADLSNKTNVLRLAETMRPHLHPGDVVVSTQPEQVPALSQYLPHDVTFADPGGVVSDPGIMNWRHAQARLTSSTVSRGLEPLIAKVPVGGHILLVNPYTSPQGLRGQWARWVRERKVDWSHALRGDRRLCRISVYTFDQDARWSAASGQLFERVRTPRPGGPRECVVRSAVADGAVS